MAADKSRALRAILLGGLIAGILDISYACIFSYIRRGTSPVVICNRSPAVLWGGVLLRAAPKRLRFGLFFHFLIATTAAAVYYLASRRLRFLVNHPCIFGPLYGIGVYLFMNFVVLRFQLLDPGGRSLLCPL